MKASKKSIALILAGTMMLGGAGAALAYGGYKGHGGCGHHGGGYSHGMPMRALKQLDLTDEQRNQLKTLVKTQREAMRDQFDAMHDNRQALREAMQKGADEKELRPLAEKQGNFVTEMILTRAQMQKKVNAILTEAQRAELQKIRKQRMDDRRERYDDDKENRRW